MKNADSKAYPQNNDELVAHPEYGGLTKREKVCYELGIPETGDQEIDNLIKKAERKKIAMAAMQGMISGMHHNDNNLPDQIAHDSVKYADALLAELEKSHEE